MSGRPLPDLLKRSARSAYHATANRILTYPSASATTLQPSIIGPLRPCLCAMLRADGIDRAPNPDTDGIAPTPCIVLEAGLPVQLRVVNTLRRQALLQLWQCNKSVGLRRAIARAAVLP